MRMNLKILLTFAMPFAAAVMSSPSASADNYYPIIEEGKVWEYGTEYTRDVDGENEHGMLYRYYKLDGTATVNGKEYHKFGCYKSEWWERSGNDIDGNLKYTLVDTDENYRPFYFLREEGEKVYVLTLDNEIFLSSRYPEESFNTEITSDRYGEFLRYDFSLTAGETIDVPVTLYDLSELAQVSVVEEEPVQVGGIPRRAFSLRGMGAFHPYPIVEGIGPTKYGDLAVFTTSFTTGSPGRGVVMQGGELARVYDPAGNVIYGTPRGTTTTYHPIIEEGKVWEYESGYTRKINGQSESGMLNQFYKFDGSATVNGNVYRRFVCFKTEYWKRTGNDYDGNLTFTLTETDNEEGVFSYLREEGEKVYVLTSDNQIFSSDFFPDDRFDTEITSDRYGEYLRYDFSLKNGETFLLCADSYVDELYQTTVAEETPEIVGEHECRAFSLRGCGDIFYDAPIVEGLGATAHGDLAIFSTTFITGKPGLDSGRQGPKAKPWRGSRLVRVYNPDGRIIYGKPRETNSVESVTADRMTLMSANGIVTAVSESGSEVRVTVYGIDGTVRAEVTGTGEATVNVSALGRGIYTVRATDGDALRVIKIRG